ncbi:MAG: hypothetical protein ACKVJU_19425 [Verrucomicrobiales bacterium]
MDFRLPIFALSFAAVSSLSFGQLKDPPPPGKAAGAEEKDWLEFYYQNPRPDDFVKEVKGFSEQGLMNNDQVRPVLIAFLSQVLRANPKEISNWYLQLQGLPIADMKTLHTAMLFSRTKEADGIMRKKYGEKFEEMAVELPKILEMALDKKETMDMLWGFFYATGSESVIRRFVIAFRFDLAPENPEGVKVPEGHRPLFKELPADVMVMLLSNSERHPIIIRMLKNFYENDKTMLPVEKEWVYEFLAEIDPKNYPPKPGPDGV